METFRNNQARFNNTKRDSNMINIKNLKLQLQAYPTAPTGNAKVHQIRIIYNRIMYDMIMSGYGTFWLSPPLTHDPHQKKYTFSLENAGYSAAKFSFKILIF